MLVLALTLLTVLISMGAEFTEHVGEYYALLIFGALGMMFRSSNFLSAFAVSFIPAMFSIALIVTGQQICARATNSMMLGLAFIWGGNALVLGLAMGLIGKLQRT